MNIYIRDTFVRVAVSPAEAIGHGVAISGTAFVDFDPVSGAAIHAGGEIMDYDLARVRSLILACFDFSGLNKYSEGKVFEGTPFSA